MLKRRSLIKRTNPAICYRTAIYADLTTICRFSVPSLYRGEREAKPGVRSTSRQIRMKLGWRRRVRRNQTRTLRSDPQPYQHLLLRPHNIWYPAVCVHFISDYSSNRSSAKRRRRRFRSYPICHQKGQTPEALGSYPQSEHCHKRDKVRVEFGVHRVRLG